MVQKPDSRIFMVTWTVVVLAVLAVVVGRTISVDPYWLWRETPPWLTEHAGHNRVLDIRQRHAKALQVVLRRPEVVVLGTSRVNAGFDPSLSPETPFYNLGISSLRIAEAEAMARHLTVWTPVKRVILGLDYFMFDAAQPVEAGFDPQLGSRKYLLGALPAALLTRQAWNDARLARSGEHAGDGAWTVGGFKRIHERDAAAIAHVRDSFYNQPQITTERQYADLDRLAVVLADAGIRLQVYLSPLSASQQRRLAEKQEQDAFDNWRGRVKKVLNGRGVVVHDFSLDHPFANEEVVDHSTDHWIDTSHFSPQVGRWILAQL